MPPNLVDNQPTVFNKLSLLSFEQIGLVKYVKAAIKFNFSVGSA